MNTFEDIEIAYKLADGWARVEKLELELAKTRAQLDRAKTCIKVHYGCERDGLDCSDCPFHTTEEIHCTISEEDKAILADT